MADNGLVKLSATEAAAEITRNHRRPVLFRISRRHRPDGRIGVWPHCGPRRGPRHRDWPLPSALISFSCWPLTFRAAWI